MSNRPATGCESDSWNSTGVDFGNVLATSRKSLRSVGKQSFAAFFDGPQNFFSNSLARAIWSFHLPAALFQSVIPFCGAVTSSSFHSATDEAATEQPSQEETATTDEPSEPASAQAEPVREESEE